jgi:hypothetical protein
MMAPTCLQAAFFSASDEMESLMSWKAADEGNSAGESQQIVVKQSMCSILPDLSDILRECAR